MTENPECEKEQKAQRKPNSGRVAINANASEESLTIRVENFIEDGDWSSADTYSNQILDVNPKNGYIYYLRILIENEVKSSQELIDKRIDITKSGNYKYAKKYGNEKVQSELDNIISLVRSNEKKDKDRKELSWLQSELNSADTPSKIDFLIETATDYQKNNQIDFSDFIKDARNKKEQIVNNNKKKASDVSAELEKAISSGTIEGIKQNRTKLLQLREYGDFESLLKEADERINKDEIKRKKVKKRTLIASGIAAITVVVLILVTINIIVPGNHYKKGTELMDQKQYEKAAAEFKTADDYKDSKTLYKKAKYSEAEELFSKKSYKAAKKIYDSLGSYSKSNKQSKICGYELTIADVKENMKKGNYDYAFNMLKQIDNYDHAKQLLPKAAVGLILNRSTEDYDAYTWLGENYSSLDLLSNDDINNQITGDFLECNLTTTWWYPDEVFEYWYLMNYENGTRSQKYYFGVDDDIEDQSMEKHQDTYQYRYSVENGVISVEDSIEGTGQIRKVSDGYYILYSGKDYSTPSDILIQYNVSSNGISPTHELME